MNLDEISSLVEGEGMELFGGFYPDREDLPAQIAENTKTIFLIGNAGFRMWEVFINSSEAKNMYKKEEQFKQPLDEWTTRIVDKLAAKVNCQALYPFKGPPFIPFQKWSLKSKISWSSPIGLLIHKKYGLWHAYRAALCFNEKLELPCYKPTISPCNSCIEKPCLLACPVDAFKFKKYRIKACKSHVSSRLGLDCIDNGCLARRACPIGIEFRYTHHQAKFHMMHFLKNVAIQEKKA